MYGLLEIFLLTEKMVRENNFLLEIDERLLKRRGSYEFDKYLQHWISKVKIEGYLTAKIISCGSSGCYKAELIVNNSIYIHFSRSFNRGAQYNAKYLSMNSDTDQPRFACVVYTLNDTKDTVEKLEFLIPSRNGEKDERYELSTVLDTMRSTPNIQYGDWKQLVRNSHLLT